MEEYYMAVAKMKKHYEIPFSSVVIRNVLSNSFDDFVNWDSYDSCISSVISKIADNNATRCHELCNCELYHHKLYEAADELAEYCNTVVRDGLYNVNANDFSLDKLLITGFRYLLEQHLKINKNNLLFNFCLHLLEKDGINKISSDLEDELKYTVKDFEGNTFSELCKVFREELVSRYLD